MIDLSSLNPEQRLAVETTDGPLLVLAGAGTGKTRVITCRIAHLIAQGKSPENILAVTFTNKAAREMRERIASLIGRELARRVFIGTFHSFCFQILKQKSQVLGLGRDFGIASGQDQRDLAKDALQAAGIDSKHFGPEHLLAGASREKNSGRAPRQVFAEAVTAQDKIMAFAALRYQQSLERLGAVDFDDLLLLCLELVTRDATVQAELRDRFRYVLVDEYQDTNRPQFQLVAALAEASRNLCVVGDDDQGIYSFRGARLENIDDFERNFPETRVIALRSNYRSTRQILESAQAVVSKNPSRREKRLVAENGDGARIEIIEAHGDEDEARQAADLLHRRHFEEGVAFSDMAVIFRTRAQPLVFETVFTEKALPYHVAGIHSFYDRKEIRDFLAYLRAAVRPEDDMSWLRILSFPSKGVSPKIKTRLAESAQRRGEAIGKLFESESPPSGFGALEWGKVRGAVAPMFRALGHLRHALADGPAGPAIDQLLEAIEFRDGLLAESGKEEGERRWQAVQSVLKDLKDRESRGELRHVAAFLDMLAMDDRDQDESQRDAITFITIHASKGLEFEEVLIPGIEEDIIPHRRALADGGEKAVEEERRLFYVGMTRARQRLTLSYCKHRKKRGSQVTCLPSRFLRDIPPEFLARPVAPARSQLLALAREALGKKPGAGPKNI